MQFYSRDQEIAILNTTFEQIESAARMVVLTGRRRIGKTYLALKHVEDKPFLYLFVSKKDEHILCGEYVEKIRARFPNERIIGTISNFKDIFELLLDIAKRQPFVLIVDEFQEFMSINPSVYSDVQQLWDLNKHDSKLQVLFLGSVYSLMNKIFENSKEPLFGRADRILKLKPFTLNALHSILLNQQHANLPTLFHYYLITGGVPKYLDWLLSNDCYEEEDILHFILSEGSPFVDEGKQVLIEELGKEYGFYFSILELLARGYTGRGEIESLLEKDIGGHLHRLDGTYGLIKKLNPLDAKPNSKLQKYKILDPFLQFWFRFIYRNRSAVEMGNFAYIEQIYQRDAATYKGHVQEQFFHELFAESGRFNRLGCHWDRSGENEIDLIAINDLEKKISIAEIKLNPNKISIPVLKEKSKNFLRPYSTYQVEYLALSLESAADYLIGARS